MTNSASPFDPGQLLAAALSAPAVSLVLAALVAGAIVASPWWRALRDRRVRLDPVVAGGLVSRHAREHRTLGAAAIAVILAFLAENLITSYALNLNGVVAWWRYATPVFAASVGLTALLLLIAVGGTTRPERPVVSARRTWLSFSSRIAAAGAAVALIALIGTTLAAGLASSNIAGGPYVFLEIGIPNETIDPIRPWFYGWSYGVPVLICTAALVAVSIAALHVNAARPFLRPETVLAEQRERREIAAGITRIATGGALLALAGAWRFIAESGTISRLTVQRDGGDSSYEAVWRYAELAAIGGWLAPALEITAFILVLLVCAQLRPTTYRAPSASASTTPAEAAR